MKTTTLLFIALVSISSFSFAQSVTIGTQTWTTKNLDVATFRNGDAIPQAKTDEEWQVAGDNKQPAWCYYDNDPKNGVKYGKLYNWYAVNDSRGLAPEGWHVPTDEEWTVLSTFLGGKYVEGKLPTTVEGKKMKSTSGWESLTNGGSKACPNCANWNDEYRKKVPCHTCKDTRSVATPKIFHVGNGTNSSGFLGLPGGRCISMGRFGNIGIGSSGHWWSASEEKESAAWSRVLGTLFSYLYRIDDSKSFGFSVRCVKN